MKSLSGILRTSEKIIVHIITSTIHVWLANPTPDKNAETVVQALELH